ncbi:hypothetical protein BI313_03875 [Xanthomonas vesicatoria]|nr:hypothetical protein BI313_03875 [Xanthomonas vesicatoria]
MDAAKELTWTYLQRVLRWWAGKGPAAHAKTSSARCPHRTRTLVGGSTKQLAYAGGTTFEVGTTSRLRWKLPRLVASPAHVAYRLH